MSDSRAEAPIGYRAGVDTQLRPSEPPIRPEGFGSACREAWLLDPDIAFLNHGSFGAVPRQVLDVQDDWRRLPGEDAGCHQDVCDMNARLMEIQTLVLDLDMEPPT